MTRGVTWETLGRPVAVPIQTGAVEQKNERGERWRHWMVAAQGGDRQAYHRLLTELLPVLRGMVRARIGDEPAADDVVQEVLVSIHAARHTYRPERPLMPWVRTIARNASIDWARRQARRRARETHVEAEQLPAQTVAHAGALSEGLVQALDRLPESQRQAVVLLKLEGLSVAEAARRAGVSSGALKLRAHRGYRALRSQLEQEEEV